ncbi:2-alkenal reductase [Planctomycetota bacterium]|jgi:S1-C subfamily serine protease|nr:2-alkenal reductase [Planctomycetota bacterium]
MLLAGAAFVMALWLFAGQSGWFNAAAKADPRPIAPRGALAPLEQTFISIFERCSPSVAHITTRSIVNDGWGGASTQEGTGSGFVWDEEGTVVTNFHVVKDAQRVRVAFGDRTFTAQVVNSTPDYDLAVLRLQGDISGLTPIRLGSSKDLRVGQTAIAIGNPFGFDQTMTTGIVSALNRSIATRESKQLSGLIQVDAAINPGNSGGPLLDSEGRLIGVTTAIYSPSGASIGIGFAVPVDTVNEVIPQLLGAATSAEAQLASSPVLGVSNDSSYRSCPVEVNGFRYGAIFTDLRKGFGAATAGLIPFSFDERGRPETWGDVIVAIDKVHVRSFDELGNALRGKQGFDTVEVLVVRGMPGAPKLLTIRVVLGKSKP